MPEDVYDKLVKEMTSLRSLRALYEDNIIKNITYKEWIIEMVDDIYGSQEMIIEKYGSEMNKRIEIYPFVCGNCFEDFSDTIEKSCSNCNSKKWIGRDRGYMA